MNRYSIPEIQSFCQQIYGTLALLITPTAYNVTFTAMTAALSNTQQINISAVADFILLGLSHRANSGTLQTVSNKTAPFGRLLLVDSGSNEQLTQQAVDLENYSENGNVAKLLPYPRVISGRSALTATLTMFAPAAETIAVDIMLQGVHVRAYSNQGYVQPRQLSPGERAANLSIQ